MVTETICKREAEDPGALSGGWQDPDGLGEFL